MFNCCPYYILTCTYIQGLKALAGFKNYLSVTADLMDTLQDPHKFASKLQGTILKAPREDRERERIVSDVYICIS